MTTHRPRFNQGLFGKANRFVTNGWTDAANAVAQHQQGLEWASLQLVQPQVAAQFLCSVLNATAIVGAGNRWTYEIELWYPPSPTGASGVPAPTDKRFSFTNAYNLREWFNTASVVDGMPTTSPNIVVGPVGSVWNGTSFPTTNLSANLVAYVTADLSGAAFAYFDRPNPVRCEGNFLVGDDEEEPS